MALMTELLHAKNIKVFNAQKQMWMAANQVEITIENLYNEAEKSYILIAQCHEGNNDDYDRIESYEPGIDRYNPWIKDFLK